MAVARASVADIRSGKLGRPRARPGSLATYAGCWHDSAVNQRQVEPELTASLLDGDRQHFCFQATRSEQGDIPFFNFKVQD